MNVWIAIIGTAVGCYAVKLVGLLVPEGVLERPLVQRLAALLPVALLAVLTAQQTFAEGTTSCWTRGPPGSPQPPWHCSCGPPSCSWWPRR